MGRECSPDNSQLSTATNVLTDLGLTCVLEADSIYLDAVNVVPPSTMKPQPVT